MSLLHYWPTRDEVDRCVKSEAESVSDEVLLAVHQQFPLAYLKVGPDGKVMVDSRKVASEDDLLRHLLGSAPEGSLVVPITGASGVGKSHLIRILDARLKKLADTTRYLVIRIPKSASLRRVVELILEAEPLQGPGYDTIRAEFNKALADVPLAQAVILFQAQLRIALDEYASTLRQRLTQDSSNELVRTHLHIAKNLPQLLSDSVTEGYFHSVVFPRIIHRSVEGISESNTEVDPTDGQFKAADFDLPDSVQIDQAALAVRNFYLMALCTMGGKGKEIAAEVLNSVVDQATRQLYKLNESLGGKTLGEVIGDIRRLLLSENPNKELIILVEDFAALVGIQDTLAKILIQHGQTDGRQTYATIRSVIAVTDGYLAGRETLATRAGLEWVVESRFDSEDETLRRTGLLVASYLNAARHGEVALKEYYHKTKLAEKTDGQEVGVPIYSDDTGDSEEVLQAFGRISGIPIFPFTESAIECLARSTLTAGNALVFNPRFIIKNVIRDVLLSGRDSFENEQFPPPVITGKPLAADVAQWVETQGFSSEIGNRYKRFVSIWGNNPSTRSDIGRIPRKVFDAFHLPLPGIEVPATETNKKKPPVTDVTQQIPDRNAKQIQDYQAALERWVQEKTTLEQDVARAIRKSIATLLNQRIDWNAERFLKREIGPDKLSIPNSAGELGLSADAFKIAETTEDVGGQLRLDLAALLRYVVVYQMNTDYPDADEDLARVSNLVDRLLPSALGVLRTSVNKQTRSAISLLAANSRLLGLAEKGRTPGAISSFLFGDVAPVSDLPETAPTAFTEWRALQRSAYQVRDQLKQLVVETAGCFQGTGRSAYGVDIVRLMECYPDEATTDVFGDIPSISADLKLSLMPMRQLTVVARLNQILREAKKTNDLIVKELGEDFDKQDVIRAVTEVASNIREAGVWRSDALGISPSEFTRLCEDFRNSSVKEALSVLQGLLSEDDDQTTNAFLRINKGAQLPLEPLLVAHQFVICANKVVRDAAAYAKRLELQYGGVTPGEKAKELVDAFERLSADLAALE